jgi:hypothetical protein
VTRSALPRIGLLALIWGSAFLWIKLADRGFSPVLVFSEGITATSLAGIALVLAGVALTRRRTQSPSSEGREQAARKLRCPLCALLLPWTHDVLDSREASREYAALAVSRCPEHQDGCHVGHLAATRQPPQGLT